MNYKEIFDNKVQGLVKYIKNYNIKSLVLGISGGIDSTVTAIIASKACEEASIKLIGRSLPSDTNKYEEYSTAAKVGSSFCTDFKEISIYSLYENFKEFLNESDYPKCDDKIPNGNIKARLRMIYLYHLAWVNKGVVLDTDNLTEHLLGFFTIHGDQGDIGVLRDLYKTEVFSLADWIYNNAGLSENQNKVLLQSINLQPTDGNGTDPDLVQYGEATFKAVDDCLKEIIIRGYVPEEMKIEHPILTQKFEKAWFKRYATPFFISTNGLLYSNVNNIIK